ncbi:MAG: hypothetical protein ACUVRD_04900 [Bacteroidia bacterium]
MRCRWYLIGVFFYWVWGQPSERLASLRIGIITEALDLTPEEAQRFWPLYNQMQQELRQLQTSIKREDLKWGSYSSEQLDSIAKIHLGRLQKEYELRMRYHDKFKQVLPMRKVIRLYWVEANFYQLLARRLVR